MQLKTDYERAIKDNINITTCNVSAYNKVAISDWKVSNVTPRKGQQLPDHNWPVSL